MESVRAGTCQLAARHWVFPYFAARYNEAMLLVEMGDHAGADSVLQAMPLEKPLDPREQSERDRMRTLVALLATVDQANRNIFQLDSSEVSSLLTLRDAAYDRPGIWAGNLLCAVYSDCQAPHTGGTATPKSGNGQPRPSKEGLLKSTAHLHLFPNPASSHVAMDYTLPAAVQQGQLLVRDAQGRQVARFVVGGEEGQQLWDTRRVPAGMYTVELLGEGKLLRSEKLVVRP